MFECIITIILAHCFLRLCSGDKVRHSLSMCSPPMFFFFHTLGKRCLRLDLLSSGVFVVVVVFDWLVLVELLGFR